MSTRPDDPPGPPSQDPDATRYSPTPTTADPVATRYTDPPAAAEPPPTVPGYEMLGELGRGGMGVVYKARQIRLNRVVALKMILSGRGASFFDLARFRVEAEAVACLNHPNIINIHDVGVHGGCPYFVLDFAEGGSLAKRDPGAPRSPRWPAEVVRSLALAIQMAHERGILHRDLKPANVLLMADGTPKISDFGLAKFERPMREVSDEHCTMSASALDDQLLQFMRDYQKRKGARGQTFEDYVVERTCKEFLGSPASGLEEPEVTKVKAFVKEATRQAGVEPPAGVSALLDGLTVGGAIMGSPNYMAPEQARGDTRGVGPAADIYALGAVLYYLLAGRPPIQGSDLRQVLERVQTEPAPPIEPGVNRDLESICRKCLEKRVERRYTTAAELAEDLRRYLDGCVPVAATDGVGDGASAGFDGPAPKESSGAPPASVPRSRGAAPRTRTWWQFWK